MGVSAHGYVRVKIGLGVHKSLCVKVYGLNPLMWTGQVRFGNLPIHPGVYELSLLGAR
jgi:hypothetical protein